MGKIRSHRDLDVYRLAFEAATEIFEMTKYFPREEVYSLTDQVRRSSRAVCANVAEAWRWRRYERSFVYRLNDAEAEAAETQTWLEFAVKCDYLDPEAARPLYKRTRRHGDRGTGGHGDVGMGRVGGGNGEDSVASGS